MLVIRGNQPEWRSIQYRDAYQEVEPGLFVRKVEATGVSSFGKKLDEESQTFPEKIDVRNVQNNPIVKPSVGSIVTPKEGRKSASPSVDYFFRKAGGKSYEGDTVSEGRAMLLAAQKAGTATPRATSLPGYANPTYGGTRATTGPTSSMPSRLAIPMFTAPTSPVLAAAKMAGLGTSPGDTQAELIGQLRALDAPGFSSQSIVTGKPKARTSITMPQTRINL